MDNLGNLLAKTSSRVASSPAPTSQNAKRKGKQVTEAAKPAVVEDEEDKSSSEDEGEDEVDAEEEEELASDKASNTKRFEHYPLVRRPTALTRQTALNTPY